jgi:hypothetical protein
LCVKCFKKKWKWATSSTNEHLKSSILFYTRVSKYTT